MDCEQGVHRLLLRRRSLINEAAQAADGAPEFSERIRAFLPTMTR